ncbi:5-bromo-4-chloroindolyl phosphate hydrolysis family protein [Brevibacillus dissolubilis]|uniref:5-bromo-4-chloroindolyl phosphate hydrolysis family protein n=1 Tax=Brevibacillus dissolubilis TaxID=1844116 RepID=UPI001115FD78|nr:5-bromo-4-chloroindolyl phosphate hydrolysis family protein [Brevibacillus dissolubilis]
MTRKTEVLQGVAGGVAFIVYYNIFKDSGLGGVGSFIIGLGVAALAYWGLGRIIGNKKPQAVTTPQQQQTEIDYQKVVGVSREEFQKAIQEGYGYVHSLQRSSLNIQNANVKQSILVLCGKSTELFKSIEHKPVKLSVIKRMTSYLQEASELLVDYASIINTNVSSPEIEKGIQGLESFLQKLTQTIEEQIVDIQEDKVQNLNMRIQALEDVMKMERDMM